MRAKMKPIAPVRALDRILEFLERELLEASDAEILQAAQALGMNPSMKGSAAFMGLKYAFKPQLSDFFEFEVCRAAQLEAERVAATAGDPKQAPKSKRAASRPKRIEGSRERKDSDEK